MTTTKGQAVSRPTLCQIAGILGPFAVLLSAALLVPESKLDVVLHRAQYTVWVSILLATPAYMLYILGFSLIPSSEGIYQYWRLLWTFSLIAYLTHFYYVFFVMYQASFAAVVLQQTALVAWSNFIFTIWWVIDVAAVWLCPSQPGWIRVQRHWFQVFSFGVFVTAFVFLRPGFPHVLGSAMIICVVLAILIRLLRPAPDLPSGKATT